MDTKLSKVLTYNERLLSLKPHDPLITWYTWGRSNDNLKNLYFHYQKNYGQ